jgi:hypothetical protein
MRPILVPHPAPRAARTARALASAILATALLACGGGDGEPTPVDPTPGTPSTGTATGGTTPAIPVLGQGVVTDRYTAEVSARGQWVYTSTWGTRAARGNVVYVWNAAGNTPVVVDTVIVDGVGTTGDVQVSDDGTLLVVATEPAPNGMLAIYSLSDPAHPRLVTRYTSPNLANGVHTAQVSRVNGRQYVFAAVNPRAGAPSRVTIVDITDPAAPREVSSQPMGRPNVHDTFVRDGVLFTANWHEGLVVWDVGGLGRGGSPPSPVRIGGLATAAFDARVGPSVHNMWWLHTGGGKRYVLVGEESTAGLVIGNSSAGDIHVVDVSDLSRPESWREVAFYRVGGAGVHNLVVDEARGILYAAFYNGGVRALDVRGDLGTCTAAQRETSSQRCDLRRMGREIGTALGAGSTPTFVWGVDLSGDAVYASDMLGGVWKLGAIVR